MSKRRLILCFASAIIVIISYARDNGIVNPVIIDQPDKLYNIARSCYFLEDKEGKYSIDEIMSQQFAGRFQKNKNSVINFGVDSSVFWIKCIITNKTHERLILELGNPMLSDIYLFESDSNKITKTHHSGIWAPFNLRQYASVNFQFELLAGSNQTETFFIRVKNYRGTHFPFLTGTRPAFYNASIPYSLLQGIYFGIILVMILYNLFIYFTLRDSAYIYYVLYMFSIGFWNATINGYTFKYLWPEAPALNQYADITAGILGITAILFATNFLNTKKNARLFHKFFIGLLIAFVLLIFVILSGYYFTAAFILDTISLLVVVCFFITAYVIMNRDYKPAKFFLIAWSLLLLSLVVFILKDFNVIPYNTFTASSMQIGSTIEAVLLSMALANRINIYKNEKEQARQQALETLKANQKLIEEQNVILEGKVEIQEQAFMKIGQEIHDNIGQILTLAKLNLSTVNGSFTGKDRQKVESAQELITKALRDLRDLSKTLNTEQIVNMGLLNAIRMELNLLEKTGIISTNFNEKGISRKSDPKKELIIFRIIQESIQNVIKHSRASLISVSADYEERHLRIVVRDNGIGFNIAEQMMTGGGISNMKSRARIVGAELNIESKHSEGTTICICLPFIE
jgi:signal transduction histidine kinase